MKNKPADRKVRKEGGGRSGPGTGAEICFPVVHGEGRGETGYSPKAHGGDHGRAKRKCQKGGEPDSYILIIIKKKIYFYR